MYAHSRTSKCTRRTRVRTRVLARVLEYRGRTTVHVYELHELGWPLTMVRTCYRFAMYHGTRVHVYILVTPCRLRLSATETGWKRGRGEGQRLHVPWYVRVLTYMYLLEFTGTCMWASCTRVDHDPDTMVDRARCTGIQLHHGIACTRVILSSCLPQRSRHVYVPGYPCTRTYHGTYHCTRVPRYMCTCTHTYRYHGTWLRYEIVYHRRCSKKSLQYGAI
jgi:hypothetical protein